MRKLRTKALKITWGVHRSMRCQELAITLVTKGNQTDPIMADMYRNYNEVYRRLRKSPDRKAQAMRICQMRRENRRPRLPGWVGRFMITFDEARLQLQDDLQLKTHGDWKYGQSQLIPFLDYQKSWMQHIALDNTRRATWDQLERRLKDAITKVREGRKDLGDFKGHINYRANTALLNGKRSHAFKVLEGPLSEAEQRMLEAILTGSLRTHERLASAKISEPRKKMPVNATCPFCNQNVRETTEHLMWDCEAWEPIRQNYIPQMKYVMWQNHWPGPANRFMTDRLMTHSLTNCWVFMEDPTFNRDTQIANLERQDPAPPQERWEHNDDHTFHTHNGVHLCASDGACKRQDDPRTRRAGYGVYFGTDHPCNATIKLPTLMQSSDRAKLAAVVCVAERVPMPICILCDNQRVVDTANALQEGHPLLPKISHHDLWVRWQKANATLAEPLNKEIPITV